MKALRKIAIILLTVALLVASLSLAVAAEGAAADVASEAASLLSAFDGCTTAEERRTALDSIDAYFKTKVIGTACEDYNNLMNRAAGAYVTVINETAEFHTKKQLTVNLKSFMGKDASVQWTDAANNAVADIISNLEKLYEENREAEVSRAPLNEYSDQYIFCDFTEGAVGFSYSYKKNNPIDVMQGDSLDPNNKSMTITAANDSQTFFHIVVPEENRASSAVIEFDFLAETECTGYLVLQAKDTNGFPGLCKISPSGIGASKGKSYIDGQSLDAFVVGEWIHVSIIVDALKNKTYVYVDYQYAGSNDAEQFDDLFSIRFDNYMVGTVKIDNLTFYAGTTLRDVDRLESYSDDERFCFYSSFLDKLDDDSYLHSIEMAYAQMGEALPLYWDAINQTYTDNATADIKVAVDAYRSFDYGAFNAKIKAYNLGVLDGYMNEFVALGRTPTNIADRSAMITFIRSYMAQNVFDKENATYKAYDEILSEETSNIELDTNINAFVDAMNKFALAPVITSMEKYYNLASGYVNQNALDMSVLDDPSFAMFKAAYESYLTAAASIEAVRNANASERFVSYIDYLKEFDGFKTEEVWTENFELFDRYITACRDIIRTGVYTTEYPGWDDAFETYQLINAYFYEKLQQFYLSEVTKVLDEFPVADTYVSKLGICRFVRNYFAASDVDYTHPEIIATITRLEIYEDEVKILAEEYAVVLEQNTKEFISYVKQMNSTRDYSDLKAIFEASLDYYYSMNVTSEEAKAALADFDAVSHLLTLIEESSVAFIETAADIDSLTGEKLYDALVACCGLLGNISTDIAGVSEAVAAYEAALDAYETKTDLVNAEIENVSVVVCSVRYCPAIKHVAAVIKRRFE
ncbi:MAG: hypothetical protein IJX97_04155 [Clostridia bacterium]|nr:hypothetical protein [Clostridia bacterium]MBQ8720065.1 hypothetical protein [Clostridia bacterium]